MFHDFVVHVRKYYFSLFQTLWPGCGLCCFSESLNNHCGWEVLALWYWIFDTVMCTDFDTVLHCGIKSTVMCTDLWCVLILTLYCNVVLNPLWCVLTFDTVVWELVLVYWIWEVLALFTCWIWEVLPVWYCWVNCVNGFG